MADDETGILVLLRYAYPEPVSVVPGSVVVMANCGHRAYISPEGADFLAGEGAGCYTICDDCQGYEVLKDKTRDRRSVPGAKAHLYELLGTAEGDQFEALARDLGIKYQ